MSSTRTIRSKWALSPGIAASALMLMALCVLVVRLARLYSDIRTMAPNTFEDFNFYLYAFTTLLNRSRTTRPCCTIARHCSYSFMPWA